MTTIPIRFLFLVFVLAEVAVLILAGSALGLGMTLLLVLAGVLAGAMLLRAQGLATLNRMRGDMAARRVPAQALLEGAAKAVAAVLLMLPGFLSDAMAVVLLVPALRQGLWALAASRLKRRAASFRPSRSPARVIELERDEFAAPPRDRRMPPAERPD